MLAHLSLAKASCLSIIHAQFAHHPRGELHDVNNDHARGMESLRPDG
jgi:hypothetical protein